MYNNIVYSIFIVYIMNCNIIKQPLINPKRLIMLQCDMLYINKQLNI